MIAYSVQGLRVLSAWAETNREALKRIKGKQLCEENSALGTVDGWRDLDWAKPANLAWYYSSLLRKLWWLIAFSVSSLPLSKISGTTHFHFVQIVKTGLKLKAKENLDKERKVSTNCADCRKGE